MPNSSVVDQRIVEMRIDNQKFESGAKKTIKTLDEIDKSLNGLSKRNVGTFDHLASSFSGISNVFNGLGGIADNVIGKISSKFHELSSQLAGIVKSLSVDQIKDGWEKYGNKTQAVQTIMAATAKDWEDQGAQMEWVNEQLDKLNWFTDETSYNFLDMANSIGKFTSNGVDLQTAVTAMEGISTWAGISGATVNDASRAMYNLSQALATGSVKLIDWKSIENANMATREFKETALETAADLKMLVKVGDGMWRTLSGKEFTTEQFNTQLSEGWFSSEVLLKTLQEYGGFTDALHTASEKTELTASELLGAIDAYSSYKAGDTEEFLEIVDASALSLEEFIPLVEDLSSAQYDLGRRAFRAAQEAKTFKDAIEATKDAVSTSWMNLFETMFGDYLQAKVFWTDVAESLYNIFAEPVNALNEIFETAFGASGPALTTGQQLFTEGIMNILHIIEAISKAISTAFDLAFSLFDDSGKYLTEHGAAMHYLGETLYYAVEKFNRFTKTVLEFTKNAMDPLSERLAEVILIVREGIGTIRYYLRLAFDGIKNIISGVLDLYSALSSNGTLRNFFAGFADIFSALISPLRIVIDYVSTLLSVGGSLLSGIANTSIVQTLAKFLTIIGVRFRLIAARFRNFMESGAVIDWLINRVQDAVSLISIIVMGITSMVDRVRSLIAAGKEAFANGGIAAVFKSLCDSVLGFIKSSPILSKILSVIEMVFAGLAGTILMAISAITSLFSKLDFSKIKVKVPVLNSLTNFFETVKEMLKLKFDGIKSWFESFKNFEIFGRLSDRIKSVFDSIKSFFTGLSFNFAGFSAIGTTIKDFFTSIINNISIDPAAIQESMKNIISTIWTALTEALKGISFKDIVDLLRIGWFISRISSIFSFIAVFKKFGKELATVPEAITGAFEELGEMFKNIGRSFQGHFFVQVAIAIGIITACVYALSQIEENALMRATAAITIIGIILSKLSETIFGKKIYNKSVDIKKFQLVSDAAGMLIGIAAVVVALGIAIGKLSKASSTGTLIGSLIGLGVLIAAIGAFVYLTARSFSKLKDYKKIDAVGDALVSVGKTMALIAVAVRLLAKPLIQIAEAIHTYQDNSIQQAGKMLADAAIILGLIILGLTYILTNIKDMTPAMINSIGNTLLKIAGSMAIMAYAVRLLAKPLIDIASALHRYQDDSISQAGHLMAGAALILGFLAVGLTYMLANTKDLTADKIDKIGNTLLKAAASMAIMAFAVRILIKPLLDIAEARHKMKGGNDLVAALVMIAAVMAALSVMAIKVQQKVDGKKLLLAGAGMALIAVALALLIPVLMSFISMSSGVFAVISGMKNFGKVIGRLMLITALLVALGVVVGIIGVGMLAAGAGVLMFGGGLLLIVSALEKLGPAMKSFVAGMIETGELITKDNLVNLGKGALVFLALAAAVWLLVKALGALDVSKIGNFGASIGKLAGSLISSVSGMFAKLGETLLANLPSIKNIIIALITIVGLFVTGAIPSLVNAIGTAILALLASVYLFVKNNRKAFEYYIFNLVAEIMNMLNDALTWAISMIIPSLVHLVSSSIADFMRSIPGLGKAADEFEAWVAESFNGDKLSEKLEGSFSRNEAFWNSVNPFGEIPPAVHQLTEEETASLGIDFNKGLAQAKDTIVTEASTLKDTVSDGLSDAFNVNTEEGSPVVTSAEDVANAGSESLINGIISNIPAVKDSGFNIGAGLADGMLDSSSLVQSAAGVLGDSALEEIKSHMEINSPSRVMARLGAWIPAGFAQGIKDNAGTATDSMTILSSAVLAAMQEAMLHVATVADDSFEFSPRITPVVDLSDVNSAAGSARSIFGGVSAAMRGSVRIAADNAGNSLSALQYVNNNEDVVSEIQLLNDKMGHLAEAVSNMKIVLDTGLLVGATSNKMDAAFGIMQMRKERGN